MNWILQITILVCVGWNFSKADQEENLHATMTSLIVTSDIKFRYATTRVSAEYTNTFNSPVTANFHVTLPSRAYISNFSMTIDGNDTYGVVKKKEEAKAIYEAAVAKGESTGYVEVKHRFTNVYDISVNIEPGKDAVFNLTYQELLKRSLGKYRHVIHLINKEIINNFLIEVFISEPQDIIDIQIPKIRPDELESPKEGVEELEEATIEYVDSKNVYIKYNPSAEEQKSFGEDGIEGLFKVSYDVERQDNPNTIYAVDGYFVHFFAPDNIPSLPKNIVFMLDVSGSMRSHKLKQLQRAMATILNSLISDLDSFLIGYFSTNVRWMNDGIFMPATKNNTAQAIREIDDLHANGGTNINGALLKSVDKLNSVSSSQKKAVLFFLTDGDPTFGVTNFEKIRENVKEANNGRVSFFMLGFGDNANIAFLKNVAMENGGFSRKIYVAADSQLQIEGLYNEISNILLKDIQITYLDEEVEPQTLTPTHFSSFYKGSEIVTTGQLNPNFDQELTVQMTMTDRDGTETAELKFDLVNLTSDGNIGNSNSPNLTELSSLSEITRNTWVFLTLKKLLNEDRTEENTEEITSLALKYGFVTPLTSMVVTKANLVGRLQEEDNDEADTLYRGAQGKYSLLQHMRVVAPNHIQGAMLPHVTHSYYLHPARFTTTVPMMPSPPTTKIPDTNLTKVINFIPGIILETLGCNEMLCLGYHRSCLTHTKVILLADSKAYIYIYGYIMRTSASNCMEALKKLVIKKKRRVLAQITPEKLTKNKNTFNISNKNEIVLNVKKYLKLTIYIKTVKNVKALTVHFTVLQPLPKPTGVLSMYMSNVTCQKKGSNRLVFDNKPNLYEKVIFNSTLISKQNHCFINLK